MNLSTHEQLLKDANKLRDYNRQAIKAVLEFNLEALGKILRDYIDFRKYIKTTYLESHIITIEDNEAKEIYVKFFTEKLEVDNFLKSLESGQSITDLDDNEIENLADLLYSRFSHYEYITKFFEISSLILTRRVPRNIHIFVGEARYCFAFEQYNAVYSICRTILEISLKYLYCIKEMKNLDYISKKKINICKLINGLCGNLDDLKQRIIRIYYHETSKLIHGKKVVNRGDAKNMFHDTLDVIQELYSKYDPSYMKNWFNENP